MYSIKLLNGKPTIVDNERPVLSFEIRDWDLAYEFCQEFNELEHEPRLLINDEDRKWLKAIDHAFSGKVQHA